MVARGTLVCLQEEFYSSAAVAGEIPFLMDPEIAVCNWDSKGRCACNKASGLI